ncbi:flagellar protein FliT [Dyella sp.]|uniref:flagellar protein FliT n=1 Tax=Dyella sp. TaxID=1869338 RepID=UPI002ED59E5E
MEQTHIPLELAYELSLQALEAARMGDWERVQELTPQRDAQLRMGHPRDERSADIIRILIEHNAQLMDLADAARHEVNAQIQQQKYSHRALSAYIASSDQP